MMAYGNVRTMQIRDYDERVIATDLINPDFVKLGESFGAIAFRAEDEGQPCGTAMRYGFASELPTIIEVPIGEDAQPRPPARSGSGSSAALSGKRFDVPIDSRARRASLYGRFSLLIEKADLVFFAGLPGVGKSLLLQQMTLMAKAGRTPRATLLQWDTARQPFETDRYPLSEGATHPLVIRATGTLAAPGAGRMGFTKAQATGPTCSSAKCL